MLLREKLNADEWFYILNVMFVTFFTVIGVQVEGGVSPPHLQKAYSAQY